MNRQMQSSIIRAFLASTLILSIGICSPTTTGQSPKINTQISAGITKVKATFDALKLSPDTASAFSAFIEQQRIRVQPFYQSGKLYGQNTTIGNAVYYLGLSESITDFAIFCQQLRFPDLKPAPKLRSLDAELSQLESETLKVYEQPDA